MNIAATIIIALILGLEIVHPSLVLGFLQKEERSKKLILFQILYVGIFSIALISGILIGQWVSYKFSQFALWYSSTVFIMLGLKFWFDARKIRVLKEPINPTILGGQLFFATLAGINAVFAGIAYGLLRFDLFTMLVAAIFALFFFSYLGFNVGAQVKKLPHLKLAWIGMLAFMVLAVLLHMF